MVPNKKYYSDLFAFFGFLSFFPFNFLCCLSDFLFNGPWIAILNADNVEVPNFIKKRNRSAVKILNNSKIYPEKQ